MPSAIAPALLTTILSLPLAAMDLESSEYFTDMRLGYGFAPVPTSFHYTYQPIPAGAPNDQVDHYSTDSLPAYSLGIVGGSVAPLGWLLGVEGVIINGKQHFSNTIIDGVYTGRQPGTPDSLFRTYGLDVMAGVASTITPNLRIEALAFVGGGRARLNELTFALDENQEGSGWYYTTGVRAGVYLTLRRLVLGASVDYSNSELHDAHVAWAFGDSNYTASNYGGIGGRFELGYRLQ